MRRSSYISSNLTHKNKHIISGPHDVTPEWLTDVLHRGGISLAGEVVAVHLLLAKELPISAVFRLGITYTKDVADESCPKSLFLKLPRALSGEAGGLPDDGRTEVEFYRDLAPGISCPPLVRCYDGAYSEETKRSHILLDDLYETHSQPEQEHPPSEEMSRLAVGALAKAHAHWWGSPTRRVEFDLKKFIETLRKSVAEFSEVVELTEPQKGAYRKMLDGADSIWGRMMRPDHVTITHGDMHWWNFLYPKDPDAHSVHIFDWHLWHVDLGARDLAFLLALGGFAEPRPEIEEALLRVYHETLGVGDYSWEMLMEDYRWSAIRNLNIPVIFWSQGKHESTVSNALRRAYAAYERLGCDSLI